MPSRSCAGSTSQSPPPPPQCRPEGPGRESRPAQPSSVRTPEEAGGLVGGASVRVSGGPYASPPPWCCCTCLRMRCLTAAGRLGQVSSRACSSGACTHIAHFWRGEVSHPCRGTVGARALRSPVSAPRVGLCRGSVGELSHLRLLGSRVRVPVCPPPPPMQQPLIVHGGSIKAPTNPPCGASPYAQSCAENTSSPTPATSFLSRSGIA